MSKELNPSKYLDSYEEICKEALQAATALLKEKGEKCYITVPEDEDYAEGISLGEDYYACLSIFAVGLDEKGKLCVCARVEDNDYGHEEFPQEWTDAWYLHESSFPSIYQFVAKYIESATTKAEADEIVETYWDDEDDEDDD